MTHTKCGKKYSYFLNVVLGDTCSNHRVMELSARPRIRTYYVNQMQVILRIAPESFPKALKSIYSTSGSKTVFHAVEGLLEGFLWMRRYFV